MMTSNEIRAKFLEFFKKRDHEVIPSAPLVPENDPSVLFNTAGMQPLVPYLLGARFPSGATRLVNSQKCVRTVDIAEIGDNTHLTFFEMLGNWSLGDYFKDDALQWSYEFLTSKKEGLGLDPRRLYVTVFEGDENAPRDDEAYAIWKGIFEKAGLDYEKRIFYMDARANWWSPGDNGPCGPDSEMFYDVSGKLTNGLMKEEFIKADEQQDVVEVWNDVFMEYKKKQGKVVGKLEKRNVDTGSGFERIVAVVQGKDNVFETDLFEKIMAEARSLSSDEKNMRIISDHFRTAVFLIADGVLPSNTDQGYVLRRLLRRAMIIANDSTIEPANIKNLVDAVAYTYETTYPNILEKRDFIMKEIETELIEKFSATLSSGLKEFDKLGLLDISGKDAFILFSTYGFPLELTEELAEKKGITVDVMGFYEEMEKHKRLSRTGSAGKFKGGLADSNETTVMLHTCTHLMLAGLRKFLGSDVHQAGSNITEARTRFDFTYPQKVEKEILDKVADYVNEAIQKKCDVGIDVMDKNDARNSGVEGSFWEKYPDMVNVYTIKCSDGSTYSRELCGGPHVENTGLIKGVFRIKKEEASSAGVRRIKAILDTTT